MTIIHTDRFDGATWLGKPIDEMDASELREVVRDLFHMREQAMENYSRALDSWQMFIKARGQ